MCVLIRIASWGDSNENIQDTFMYKKKIENISLLCLLTRRYALTLISSNYPCLEHISSSVYNEILINLHNHHYHQIISQQTTVGP